MAISHVCLSCGLDLARVRARLEPRYALPIVVCPDCGWAAVRRKPRRSFGRLPASLLYCGAAIVGLACVLAMIPLLEWDARAVFSARRAAQYQLALPTLATALGALIVPLALGLRFGRNLARLAVNALLPPRLRGPIAVLWTGDK